VRLWLFRSLSGGAHTPSVESQPDSASAINFYVRAQNQRDIRALFDGTPLSCTGISSCIRMKKSNGNEARWLLSDHCSIFLVLRSYRTSSIRGSGRTSREARLRAKRNRRRSSTGRPRDAFLRYSASGGQSSINQH
jgi:hypothetical protein